MGYRLSAIGSRPARIVRGGTLTHQVFARPHDDEAMNNGSPGEDFATPLIRNQLNIGSLQLSNLGPANDLPGQADPKSTEFRSTLKIEKIKCAETQVRDEILHFQRRP